MIDYARLLPPPSDIAVESGLVSLAKELNPLVGYWDPLGLVGVEVGSNSAEQSIGWLRHSELKHGRVSMAGFVGYIVHENGIHWPFKLANSFDYASVEGLPAPALWDAIPSAAKLQIIGAIGLLELWSEWVPALKADGLPGHYMRGGKPGHFPSLTFNKLDGSKWFSLPNLYDPFGFYTTGWKMSPEKKNRLLNVEINNGRLAMIGLAGFLAEANIRGSVPLLTPLIKHLN